MSHRGRVRRVMARAGVHDSPLGRARNIQQYQAALERLSDRELMAEMIRLEREHIASLSDDEVIALARGEGDDDNDEEEGS